MCIRDRFLTASWVRYAVSPCFGALLARLFPTAMVFSSSYRFGTGSNRMPLLFKKSFRATAWDRVTYTRKSITLTGSSTVSVLGCGAVCTGFPAFMTSWASAFIRASLSAFIRADVYKRQILLLLRGVRIYQRT